MKQTGVGGATLYILGVCGKGVEDFVGLMTELTHERSPGTELIVGGGLTAVYSDLLMLRHYPAS